MESDVSTLKESIANNDIAAIQSNINIVNESLQKVGQAIYSQEAPTTHSSETDPGSQNEGEATVEGEYRAVN